MATTVTGGWAVYNGYNCYRSVLTYELSTNNATQAVITVTGKLEMAGTDQLKTTIGSGKWTSNVTAGSTTSSKTSPSTDGYYSPAKVYTFQSGIKSQTITKTHSTQNVTVRQVISEAYVWNNSSTASTTVTIPAKTHYTVSFNANGGSGAPSSQTKWYGETLTLSSTVPTRANYTFLGWATSASATTATYKAGGAYIANSGATLYAVWQLAHIAPTIGNLRVYRTASATSSTASDEGTNAWVECGWSVDTSTNSSNVGSTLTVKVDGTQRNSASLSGTSATTSLSAWTTANQFDVGQSYQITVTVTDANGLSTSRTLTLSPTFFTLDFRDGGKGIAFGKACPATDGLHFGEAMPPHFDSPSDWTEALGIGTIVSAAPSAVNVASSSNTTLGSITLPAGTWMVVVSATFASNNSGRRTVYFDTNSNVSTVTTAQMAALTAAPANGGMTKYSSMAIVTHDTQTVYYCRAWQNSGSSLSTQCYLRAVKIA